MTSPIRQNLFERECDMPLLEARHLALLLLGLDASQPANALPEEHQENYRILHDAISRTIKATGMVSAPANKRMFYADVADFSHSPADQAATISSGSFRTDGMIVIPCSMKTLAGIRDRKSVV